MKRVLILSLVFMLLMGLNTFATQTRTLTMGDNDGIMVDDYNIFRFPGRLFSYPNIAVAEFATTGGADFQQFGVNWKFGDESPWVLGTYFRNNNFAIIPRDYFGNNLTSNNYPNQFGLFPGPTDPAVINNLDMENHRMNLLYGRKLGTNDFGFQFEYIRSSYARDFNDTSATPINYDVTEEKFGQYTFMFGLTEGGTGQWDLAAGVTLGSWTDKNALDSTESKPDGYYDLWAEGRYFWVQNPTITLVPHGMFVVGSRGVKNLNNVNDPNDDFTANNDRFMLEGGIGMNYTPSSNLLAVMDFGFMYGNVKTEFKYVDPLDNEEFKSTRFTVPFFKLGLEADVFRWMDVRFGATSFCNVDKEKEKAAGFGIDNEVTEKYANNNTFLGFAFHWGRLHVDTYTDPQIVLDGFNFISGSTDADDLNFQVSALYEMF